MGSNLYKAFGPSQHFLRVDGRWFTTASFEKDYDYRELQNNSELVRELESRPSPLADHSLADFIYSKLQGRVRELH